MESHQCLTLQVIAPVNFSQSRALFIETLHLHKVVLVLRKSNLTGRERNNTKKQQ